MEEKMLLVPQIPKESYLGHNTFPVSGNLEAEGVPRRRSWDANYRWNLRNGKVSGSNKMHSQWLSKLLDDLALFEQQTILGHLTDPKTAAFGYNALRIYYAPELYRSLNMTLKRWCKQGKLIKLER